MEGRSTQAETLGGLIDEEIENDYEVQDLPLFNQGDYLSTNLIHTRDITLADNFEVIDPKASLKEMNKEGIVETLVNYEDINRLIIQAYQQYSKIYKQDNSFQGGNIFQQPIDLISYKLQISQEHKLYQKEKRTDSFMDLLNRSNRRNSFKLNTERILSKSGQGLKEEVSYLFNHHHLKKSTIKKRLCLSESQLSRLLNSENINLQIQNQKRKRRFSKLHLRARIFIKRLFEKEQVPISSSDIQRKLQQEIQLKVSKTLIQRYLKEKLNMSYKKIKKISLRHNILESKLQRQYAAQQYITHLYNNVNIINIDESIISETDHRAKSWSSVHKAAYTMNSQRIGKTSIIGGVSSKGDFYYSINLGTNNSEKIWLFFLKLCLQLSSKDKQWRKNTIIMLDNAPYHRSKMLMNKFQEYKIPIMFLGPYQFGMAPIELMFSYIKQHDLNYLKTILTNRQDFHNNCQQNESNEIHEGSISVHQQAKCQLDLVKLCLCSYICIGVFIFKKHMIAN